ncbi:MAG: DNA repair protein RecN [Thermodesulfobacteriota bacterium]
MLQELSIRNFAIIDDLQIHFSDGLTILSGETGAGKSVIINAVNLLLGTRASVDLIRSGAETAELEALFVFSPDSQMHAILASHGYDASESLLVRRIISRNERHRIYINDRLATIQLLHALTENLASISGQHAHQGLLKEDQQLSILDQFGGLIPLRSEVYTGFHELLPAIAKLNELNMKKNRQDEHVELLRFQKKEISAAAVVPDEDKALEQEKIRLKNSETLYQVVFDGIETLYSGQGAVIEHLVTLKKQLDKAGQIDPQLLPAVKGMNEVSFQIEDLVENLRGYLKTICFDENRLEAVESRLDILQKLKRKYGGSIERVISHFESIDDELSEIENLSEKIKAVKADISRLHGKLAGLSLQLSQKRTQAAQKLSKMVEKELGSLKMSHTRFEVSFRKTAKDPHTDPSLILDDSVISETGIDRITFMIAPNIGEELKPLANIASGGELSRVVLALKAILADTDSVETIVFDEVDAGIGGGVAEVVGKKLADLARFHQIVCITHLPQIAKFGTHHFKISKQVSGGRTVTMIKPLDNNERIKEIARMLGGATITKTALDHASEMLRER